MDDGDGLGLGDDFFDGNDSGDLNNIFDEDDDNPVSLDATSKPEHESQSQSKLQVDEVSSRQSKRDEKDDVTKASGKDDSSKADKKGKNQDGEGGKSKKKKRRRSSPASVEGDRAGPPPAWHSEAADKPHREAMIREIAQLLQARKKTAPTKEWMQQLPHKARVLEDRLYRKAPCLEAYLNRSTLKNRLRTLAVTITAHYKTTTKGRTHSKRSSTGSVPSVNSDTGISHRDSVTATSLGSPSSQGISLDAELMAAAAGQGSQNGSRPMSNNKVVPPEVAMSELARQKQVNEELQQQILANIRQQQQLVHSIRRGSNKMQGHALANANGMSSGGGMQGNPMANASSNANASNNNAQGNVSNSMQAQFNNMQNANQQMQAAMAGNNMQCAAQFSSSNNEGNSSMSHRESASSSMGNAAFEAQTNLMRHASAPNAIANSSGGGNLNAAGQMALMRQQSAIVQGSDPNALIMQNAGMQAQATMLRRSSSTGTPNQAAQAQFHAQQTAMMRQASSSQAQNQAAQAQMQAALMRQASAGSNQFNVAQAQALMRQASAGGNQMNPQAQAALMRQASADANQLNAMAGGSQAQAQAALMRRASQGMAPGAGPGGLMLGVMNQQMGNTGGNAGGMPNGQMMQNFGGNQQQMMQANQAAMMQSMNAAVGMQQNAAQFPGMQQQMGMAMHGRNSMMSVGNEGNALDNMNLQAKKAGDDMGLSQNSFGW